MKNSITSAIFLTILVAFSVTSAQAQILVEDAAEPRPPREQPRVGKGAASDYFKKRSSSKESSSDEAPTIADGDRVMGLHIGTFVSDKAYRWGRMKKLEDEGGSMIGVTYRVGEWTKSMDLNLRVELMTYDIDDEDPVKLSIMPVVAFPDARSAFPVYFGAGLGVGVFFKQAGDESDLAADYALIVGARFPNVWSGGGLFFETGLKGQVFLLSSGQQDGVFLSGGALFTF